MLYCIHENIKELISMENADTFVATSCNGGLYITTFGKSCTAPGHFWGPAIHSYYLIHYITYCYLVFWGWCPRSGFIAFFEFWTAPV